MSWAAQSTLLYIPVGLAGHICFSVDHLCVSEHSVQAKQGGVVIKYVLLYDYTILINYSIMFTHQFSKLMKLDDFCFCICNCVIIRLILMVRLLNHATFSCGWRSISRSCHPWWYKQQFWNKRTEETDMWLPTWTCLLPNWRAWMSILTRLLIKTARELYIESVMYIFDLYIKIALW